MKHFQKAHVFGFLKSIKEKVAKSQVPYLELKISCNSEHGNLIIWGKIFGQAKSDLLKDHYKRYPDQVTRFSGFFQQYINKDKMYHNFTFTDFVISPGAKPRAVIVLTGLCYWIGDEYVMFRTNRLVFGNEKEEDFKLFFREQAIRDCLEKDSDFKIKIRIEKEKCDAEFLDFSGPDLPFICELVA